MIQLNSNSAPNKNLQLLLLVNLTFLLLALIANSLLERWSLFSAHALAFSALTVLLITSLRWQTPSLQAAYLGVMFGYFFSFFWVGDPQTYDLLWLTLFPAMAAFVLEHEGALVFWLGLFVSALGLMFVVSIQMPLAIPYSSMVIGNLVFAVSFISLLAWSNHRYKAKFLASQKAFQSQLEQRVEQATETIRQLNHTLELSQRDVVLRLGEICEVRSQETGQHVQRVAEYSYHLAKLAGLDTKDIDLIRDAAPLHDVGKVAIADAILNKPGKYDEHEYRLMQQHAQIGYELLNSSPQPLLQAAAIIARDHHEWWNGEGYPNKQSGENIHIYGRIVAIADVFDALSFERVYKPAWSDDKITALFEQQLGVQFDPTLAGLFLAHYADFVAIRQRYNQGKQYE